MRFWVSFPCKRDNFSKSIIFPCIRDNYQSSGEFFDFSMQKQQSTYTFKIRNFLESHKNLGKTENLWKIQKILTFREFLSLFWILQEFLGMPGISPKKAVWFLKKIFTVSVNPSCLALSSLFKNPKPIPKVVTVEESWTERTTEGQKLLKRKILSEHTSRFKSIRLDRCGRSWMPNWASYGRPKSLWHGKYCLSVFLWRRIP